MTTYEQSGQDDGMGAHDAAASYVLGILDDADATAFEAHLAGCHICALHLEEFAGMEPMLAMLADSPDPFGQSSPFGRSDPFAQPSQVPAAPAASPFGRAAAPAPPPAPAVTARPSPRLLDRLVDEVAVKRAKRRRRSMYLVAAAAALVIGGPAVAVVATSGDGGTSSRAADPHPTSPAEDAFMQHMPEKVRATDPVTKVSATVGMEPKGWGTHAALELKNVKGPLKCSLIAVSKTGEEEIVTSWAVPKWGYGLPESTHDVAKNPLYVHGGAAMNRDDIDHFEVRTFDGKRLVEVEA